MTTLRNTFRILALAAVLASQQALADAPANDAFTSRSDLGNASTNFTGTLADATVEANEPSGSGFGDRSVWWSWTATNTTAVTLELLSATNTFSGDCFAVFSGADIDSLTELNFNLLDTLPHRNLSFVATAGMQYQIRVLGSADAVFTFRLIATNTPVLLLTPQSRTVSPGASVLFATLAATATQPFYQWRFNGTNLPGETSPMLALHDVTTNHSGVYSVLVTNTGGGAAVAEATLLVSADDQPVLRMLEAAPGNRLLIELNGALGRAYRIESSTNLQHWSAEGVLGTFTSVVIATNPVTPVQVSADTERKFIRLEHYSEPNEECMLNLRQIWFTKQMWAIDNRSAGSAQPMPSDLMPYFKDGLMGFCPAGGSYSFDSVAQYPACSRIGHWSELPR